MSIPPHTLLRLALACVLMTIMTLALVPGSPSEAALKGSEPFQCSYCIRPSARTISSDGGPATVEVIAGDGCAWTAESNDPFITITGGASGAGNGIVTYTVAANTLSTPRTGSLTVAGQTATITQDAACLARPAGLVGWWPGENNAIDIAGSNHGTVQGGTLFSAAKVKRGFRLDGIDDHVEMPDAASHKPANISVEAWVKFDSFESPGASAPGLQYIVFKKNARASFFEGYALFKTREFGIDRFRFTITSAAGVQAHTFSTTIVATGQFYHVVGTYDGSTVKLYVNGVLEGQTPATFPLDYGTRPLFFGTSGEAFDGKLRGVIDEVSIYNRALSDTEIAAIFNADLGGKCRAIDFVDVGPGHIFFREIRRLSALGITLGCAANTYCPDLQVTRGQMAAFIIRALGIFNPPQPASQRFVDVPPTHPFYAFIEQMAQRGITLGCSANSYCPDDPVLRDQMAAFIIRALGTPNPVTPAAQRFVDVPPTNAFYSFIEEMALRRITLGCTVDMYCPSDVVTRSQMAAFLVRAFDTEINLPPSVFAGSDQTVFLPSTASLNGSVSHDGQPECGMLSFNWSQVSGPGSVMFGDTNSTSTTASFSAPGTYVLRLTASDGQLTGGDDVTITVNPVNPANQPPTVEAGPDQTISLPNGVALNGSVTDDGVPGAAVTVSWTQVGGPGVVTFGDASGASTTATFALPGSYVLRLSGSDSQLTTTDEVMITVNQDSTPPPPDPSTVAPPLDMTGATTIGEATEFLYTGPDPIQTGVAPGTIEMRRAAVLRGRVLSKDNTPLARVKITVLGHPELGQTFSRADGRFDMAVNGGGPLTVRYEKTGFLPVQRTETVPWQDYCGVPDVVMMGYDPQVTFIDLNAAIPIQVARGTISTDDSGARRSTLLFRQGTTATMKLPGGAMQGIDMLHVRATEFTVGANGQNAMPGDLPPTSFYTYAVEYSIDEAVAAGAVETTFSQPVIQYNENFLNFQIGIDIPSGTYDRVTGQWVASASGRIVKILTSFGGLASLDLDGSGLPATDAQYAALGITTAERQALAMLYSVGQELWRVPVDHFSAWDSNWGWGPPGDASGPSGPPPPCDTCQDGPCEGAGCVIQFENQALGEEINIIGTPYSLRYSSDRQKGRTSNYSLKIALSEATIPASLKRIDLTVEIAGQTFAQSFPAQANQSFTFNWDGKDAYGRAVQGRQLAVVTVGYHYDGVYELTARFGYNGNGIPITGDRTRGEITIPRVYQVYAGAFDARALALGGWTMDVHHVRVRNALWRKKRRTCSATSSKATSATTRQ